MIAARYIRRRARSISFEITHEGVELVRTVASAFACTLFFGALCLAMCVLS